MWMIFGALTIFFTIWNIALFTSGKDYKLIMALALSFTALTLCAENTLVTQWVEASNWAALLDVVPYMEKPLWILTCISILLNIAPILIEKTKKNT